MSQTIWGNKYITHTTRNKPQCLLFKSFINCNIIKVSDLKFTNHKIDQQYLFEKLTDKRNVFQEITRLTQALKPYRLLINHHTTNNRNPVEN
jgi:hypothetical protein